MLSPLGFICLSILGRDLSFSSRPFLHAERREEGLLPTAAVRQLHGWHLPWGWRRRQRLHGSLTYEDGAGEGGGDDRWRRRSELLERFETWLVDQGVDVLPSTLQLQWHQESGFGLYCTRAVIKDTIVVSVPPSLALTPTLPTTDLVLPPLHAPARLALRLLYEKALASCGCEDGDDGKSCGGRYGPYLALLPSKEEMSGLPLLWQPQDIALLAPSPLHDDVVELHESVESERVAITEALKVAATEGKAGGVLGRLLRLVEEDDGRRWWLWARAIVMSRPYYMEAGEEESLRLIPLLDVLNHHDAVEYAVLQGDGVFVDRDAITLTADRDYQAGQQLMATYGRLLSSATKLYSFGYLDPPWTPPTGEGPPWPRQGTAFLQLSLSPGLGPEADKALGSGWKHLVLKSQGLGTDGWQRFEIAARLVVTEEEQEADVEALRTGKGGAGDERMRMAVEDVESLERMIRFLRLKWWRPPSPSQGNGPFPGPLTSAAEAWEWLGGGVGEEVEERVRREVRDECQRQIRQAHERLWCVVTAKESRRVATRLMRWLVEGEIMALQAVANHMEEKQ